MELINKADLKRWEKMTDNNEHNKVRILIAKKFGFEKELIKFKEIEREHEKIGQLPYNLMVMRSEYTQNMLQKIEAEYSTYIKNLVNRCL